MAKHLGGSVGRFRPPLAGRSKLQSSKVCAADVHERPGRALHICAGAAAKLHLCADLAGRIRNQLRSRAAEAEQAYWLASEAFIAARLARAAAIAAQRAARQVCDGSCWQHTAL